MALALHDRALRGRRTVTDCPACVVSVGACRNAIGSRPSRHTCHSRGKKRSGSSKKKYSMRRHVGLVDRWPQSILAMSQAELRGESHSIARARIRTPGGDLPPQSAVRHAKRVSIRGHTCGSNVLTLLGATHSECEPVRSDSGANQWGSTPRVQSVRSSVHKQVRKATVLLLEQ